MTTTNTKSSRGRASVLFLFLGAVLATAGHADDTVDLQLQAKDKVLGTIRPEDERETFLLVLPQGASVSATARPRGKGGPDPVLDLVDAQDAVLETGTPRGRNSKIAGFVAPASGDYRVRVVGDGQIDGDYDLKVRIRPKKRWRDSSTTPLAAAAEATYTFAAPLDATATVKLSAPRGSDFLPELLDMTGPQGFATVNFTTPNPLGRTQRTSPLPLGPPGDYTLRFRNAGTAAGDWNVQVNVSPVPTKRHTVDIRDESLQGQFSETQAVFGREVSIGGGTINPAVFDELSGITIEIPPNSLPAPTVISVAEIENFFVDDDNNAAGPAIRFEPAGTEFGIDATMTMPFNAQSFDDPQTEMTIFVENQVTGELEPVPGPYQFSQEGGQDLVGFPVGHFSAFQSTSTKPPPVKGTYGELEFFGGPVMNWGGRVMFGLNLFRALAGPRTGNAFQRTIRRRGILFVQSGAPTVDKGLRFIPPVDQVEVGTLAIGDKESVSVDPASDSSRQVRRGRNQDLLLTSIDNGNEVGGSIILREAKGRPTRNNVAGGWHLLVFECAVTGDASGQSRLTFTGENAFLHIERNGVVRVFNQQRATMTSGYPNGTWEFDRSRARPRNGKRPPNGRVTPQPLAKLIELDLGVGSASPTTVDLAAFAGGRLLAGVVEGVSGENANVDEAYIRLVLLVRASENAGAGKLDGRSLLTTFGVSFEDRDTDPQGLTWRSNAAVLRHDGKRKVTQTGTRTSITHNQSGAPGAATRNSVDLDRKYAITPLGGYSESGQGVRGAISRKADFLIVGRFDEDFFGIGIAVVAKPDGN